MCDVCYDQKFIIGADGRPKRCPSCTVIPAKAGIHTAPARVGRYNPAEAQAKLDEFNGFLSLNAHVYKAFEKKALEMFRAGDRRVPSKKIIENIRGEVTSIGGKYGLDNNWAPWLARKVILAHPELNELIETRASDADILLTNLEKQP